MFLLIPMYTIFIVQKVNKEDNFPLCLWIYNPQNTCSDLWIKSQQAGTSGWPTEKGSNN